MYDELVESLRGCGNDSVGCGDCPYKDGYWDGNCLNGLLTEAADAIEELVRKEKFHAFLWNTIQPNEMEQYLTMYRAQAVPSELPKEEAT